MRTSILFVVALLLSSPVEAQPGAGALSDRLNSITRESATEPDCERQVARAADLNAPDLLSAAIVCLAVDRLVEGNFLLAAGQVRAIVDLGLTVPASKADSDVQASLYGVLYFHAGGPGREEVLREATARDRFFNLFDSWSPRYSSDYDPGWKTRRRPAEVAYQAAVGEAKAARRQQIAETARLYSDETYYLLHRRFQELQVRTGGRYEEGTPDANLSRDLVRQMDERSVALGFARDFDGPDLANRRFPPAEPGPEEEILSSVDPTAQRCADIAERSTIAEDSRLLRVLITRDPEWGTIWRADVAGGVLGPQRVTCTETTSSSRPMTLGDETIPSLPESRTPSGAVE